MSGKKGKKGPAECKMLKEEDHALWNQVCESVTPLAHKHNFAAHKIFSRDASVEKSSQDDETLPRSPAQKRAKLVPTNLSPRTQKTAGKSACPELTHNMAPGVDRRTAERLRRGKMVIEARLDLHGMTQNTAFQSLENFILGAWDRGNRCVLVVTGKGRGILQTEIPRRLNLPLLREKVLSFSYAQPQDGGTGALYILLKKKRI